MFGRVADKNEMNRASGHLCAHIGLTGPGKPPKDGEMIEMTLSSRHRIRNSSPGGLRPSTLPLGHGGSPQYWLSHVDGEGTFFVSFKPPRPGTEPRTLAWTATTTLGPPPPGSQTVGQHLAVNASCSVLGGHHSISGAGGGGGGWIIV